MPRTKSPDISILVVGNGGEIASRLGDTLHSEYRILVAANNRKAGAIMRKTIPPVILLNLCKRNDDTGKDADLDIGFISKIQEDIRSKIIVISEEYNHAEALRSIRLGAFDYFARPVDFQRLETMIRRAAFIYALEEENRRSLRKDEEENSF
jgi:two-component system NtrC family response regulator